MNHKIHFIKTSLTLIFSICFLYLAAQTTKSIEILDGEKWWGGHISLASQMPFKIGFKADLSHNRSNQAQPLLLSNKGRYIWCEEPFVFEFKENQTLEISEIKAEVQHGQNGNSLQTAHQYAVANFFQFDGKIPHELLFNKPQYNTWIELIYNQNQQDVMHYAKSIIANGFPPGVLMIDDNWQKDYGDWNFKPERFPDPKGMIDSLHEMGFKVMVWVCPMVSPDSENFRFLYEKKNAFLRDPLNPKEAKMIRWWNGFSAVLDFTEPNATKWFKGELTRLQKDYGVDGFKLDAGDFPFYYNTISNKEVSPNEQGKLFAEIGLEYSLNEYRACWKLGGKPLAQRLADKSFNWKDLGKLIPEMNLQGLMGYPYACPDMIGGGEYRSFLGLDSIDQNLIVRSAQVHALMPMMQFSVAPWRVLDQKHLEACQKAAQMHAQFGEEILELAHQTSKDGAPIVSSMEFAFPQQNYEAIHDQFILGNKYLIAPILKKDAFSRMVIIPPGKWKDQNGKMIKGPRQIKVEAALDVLPMFTKMN